MQVVIGDKSRKVLTVIYLQVYRTLMDAVVLDWTISLSDKDRMKSCAVTYLPKEEAKESTITIDPFMPKSRTFLLENLRPNTVSFSESFSREPKS